MVKKIILLHTKFNNLILFTELHLLILNFIGNFRNNLKFTQISTNSIW
jgi:hypothetical protein